MTLKMQFGAATLMLAASAAVAQQPTNIRAWFDLATGTGFISAGTIQSGWNGGGSVTIRPSDYEAFKGFVEPSSFFMIVRDTYTGICNWTTRDGASAARTQSIVRGQLTDLMFAVTPSRSPIKMGVLLQGYVPGSQREYGVAVPVNGGPCTGENGITGSWTYVCKTSSATEVEQVVRGAAAGLKVWPLPPEFRR